MKRTKLIEEYIDGTLTEDEKLAFLSKVEQDKELASLIRLHAEVNDSIRDNELYLLQQLIKEVSTAYFTEELSFQNEYPCKVQHSRKKRIWNSYCLRFVAATILLIIVGIIIKSLFFYTLPSEVLYETHYQPYIEDIVVRSGDPIESELIIAIQLYQDGKYNSAYEAFEDISDNISNYNLVLFYQGLISLGLQDYDKAIVLLNSISDSWEDSHSVHRDWYLALALLRQGEESKAIRIFNKLKSSDSYYHKSASRVLKRIRN